MDLLGRKDPLVVREKSRVLIIVMGPMGGKAVALKMGSGWGSAGFV